MNLKTGVKYQLWEGKRSLIIFYGIIYAIYTLAIVATKTFSPETLGISGIELSSMIFLFILGLNLFSESFRMFLQNGLSRKTLFFSLVLSILPIAAFMAIVDSINGVVASLLVDYEGMYLQIYGLRYGTGIGVLQTIEGLFWYITAYAMVAMLGLLITMIYYRLNKMGKLLISIGFPVTFVVILPFIDSTFTNGAIFKGIYNFFAFAWGFQNGLNPYYSMITCTLFFALFGGLAYLLMRKAVVRQ